MKKELGVDDFNYEDYYYKNKFDIYGDINNIDINDDQAVKEYSQAILAQAEKIEDQIPSSAKTDSEWDATPPDLEGDFETWRTKTDLP